MKLRFLILVVFTTAIVQAAPIRVGILKGVTSGRYWHTSIHPGSAAIAAILSNPAMAGMNQPIIPTQGFNVTMYGVDTSCAVSGCNPTADQIGAFIAALDSLDVAVFINNIEMSGVIRSPQRQRVVDFWKTKGVVSIHGTTDTFGGWPAWDSLNAARFQNHPSSERMATLRLDTVGAAHTHPGWQFLNRGLPDTVRIFEEWFSFTQNANVIRAYPYVKATVNIDENSYEGGLGGARAMGADHPMSWFREFPEGGRFLFTALGHRKTTFDSVYFFRRQLYNAILWASGYNVTTAVDEASFPRAFSDAARITFTGSALAVSVLHEGAHSVEIRSLDGRLVQSQRGVGRVVHRFEGLPQNAMLAVSVKSDAGRATKLVAAP